MISFSQIYEGWRNQLVPPKDMKQAIEDVSRERLDVCSKCEHYSENVRKKGLSALRPDVHCTNCGCTLSAKTRCLSCSCPIGFWKEIVSQDEEESIKKKIDGRRK